MFLKAGWRMLSKLSLLSVSSVVVASIKFSASSSIAAISSKSLSLFALLRLATISFAKVSVIFDATIASSATLRAELILLYKPSRFFSFLPVPLVVVLVEYRYRRRSQHLLLQTFVLLARKVLSIPKLVWQQRQFVYARKLKLHFNLTWAASRLRRKA